MRKNLYIYIFLVLFLLVFSFPLNAGYIVERAQDGYYFYLPTIVIKGEKPLILICFPNEKIGAKEEIKSWSNLAEKNGFLVIELDIKYEELFDEFKIFTLYQKIEDILKNLYKDYRIKEPDIYLVGTSKGGQLALFLALKFPKKFNRIALVNGAKLNSDLELYLENAKDLKFYLIHQFKNNEITIIDFDYTRTRLEKNGAIVEFYVFYEDNGIMSVDLYEKLSSLLIESK
ncbi:MAG: acyl-CoA thioester hydrolase/BAAT C-terminal domain-containing protein [Candidatus Aenigmatarchaeota archaeon]